MAKLQQQTVADMQDTVTFPDHLIVDYILPRLQVKPLIRFKSVSKFWHSSISSPQFAKSHLKFSSFPHQFILLNRHKLMLLPYDEFYNLKDPVDLDFPVEFLEFPKLKFVGSSNGLVCLYNHEERYNPGDEKREYGSFIIWNPATRKCRIITKPDDFRDAVKTHWFGHIPSIDDYKIVAIIKSYDDASSHFDVFSIRTGRWKRMCEVESCFYQSKCWSDITFVMNDIVYWNPDPYHGPNNDYGIGYESIVGFDLVNDQLKEAPWMDWLGYYHVADFFVMNGCLSLLCIRSNDPFDRDVWSMQRQDDWSSWEKSFSVHHLGQFDFLSITPTGMFLVQYHSEEQEEEKLKIIDPSKYNQELQGGSCLPHGVTYVWNYDVGCYVESLISPFEPFGTTKSIKEAIEPTKPED